VRSRKASDKALFIPAVHSESLWQNGEYLAVNALPLNTYWLHSKMSDVYLQECPAPDTGRVINLEAMPWYTVVAIARQTRCWYVRYALNDPTNLRHSHWNRTAVDAYGHGSAARAEVLAICNRTLTSFMDIWDRWPDAVIEASRFSKRVGVFDSQTIIWEAREF
jgi:hypothetical protein